MTHAKCCIEDNPMGVKAIVYVAGARRRETCCWSSPRRIWSSLFATLSHRLGNGRVVSTPEPHVDTAIRPLHRKPATANGVQR